jgi:hypothetical protein
MFASWAAQHGWSPAWLSYGEAAKTNPPPGPEIAAEPAAPSPDQQQLKAMALSLAAVRQRVEQLAAGQEQLVAGQEQTASDIAKLQAAEQDIRHKISAAPPRPATAPASKPMSPPPSRAPTPLR